MLHRTLIVLVIASACDSSSSDDSLLSASRLSLRERETATVQVRVESLDDVEIEAPPGIAIERHRDTRSFEVTPTCDAGGSDTTHEVIVRTNGRSASLVIAVTDDTSAECLAKIEIWDVPCPTAACSVPCGAPPDPLPTRFAFGRGETYRLCARAEALDKTRPLTKTTFTIEPFTRAFSTKPSTDDVQTVLVSGHDFLVGPFDVTFTAVSHDVTAIRRLPLLVGNDGDIGLEIPNPLPLTGELARSAVSLTVHRMGMAPCALRFPILQIPIAPSFDAKLTAASGESIEFGTAGELSCTDAAHVPFTLSVVPHATADAAVSVPVLLPADAKTVTFPVTSRIEDLFPSAVCSNSPKLIACADIDNDSTLDLVMASGSSSCTSKLTDFRGTTYTTAGSNNIEQLFTIPTSPPTIYALDATTRGLLRLDRNTRTWVVVGTATLGARAAPARSAASGLPDTWVGIATGQKLRFTSFDASSAVDVGLPATVAADFSTLGVIAVDQAGGGPQRLVIVGSITGGYRAYLLGVDWSKPELVDLGTTLLDDMPTGATVTLATRAREGQSQDVIAAFLTTPFSNAVTEIVVSTGLGVIASYGGVRSVASTPEGALLGAATGAQYTDIVLNATKYRTIDPIATLSQSYGDVITACLDGQAKYTGFFMRAGDRMRVARPDVVRETP